MGCANPIRPNGCFLRRWVFFAVCVIAVPALGQRRTGFTPAATRDAYGNARSQFAFHRPIDVYQNAAQRRTLRLTRYRARTQNRRGRLIPFALPGDLLAPGGRLRMPAAKAPSLLSLQTQRAFERYGGFRARSRSSNPPDALTAFARRHALVAASSLTAPVSRALWQQGTLRFPTAASPPAKTSSAEPHEPHAPTLTLDARLRARTDRIVDGLRRDAWAWFSEGAYRRAGRAFESTYTLDPADMRSRVGELFCNLSLGSRKTAFALFRELMHRDAPLFSMDLDMRRHYGADRDAQGVRLQLDLFAGLASEGDAAAFQAFILWSLGERDDAIVAAEALVRRHPSPAYADWPARMREAQRHAERGTDSR